MPDPIVRLDLNALTLGDAAYVERLSGLPLSTLVGTTAGRMMMAIALDDLRTYPGSEHSDKRRSWPEISALRLLDASPSTSPSSPAGPSATSTD